MRVELAKSRETTIEEARLIEQYRRDMEKSQEDKERLERKHKIETQNLQRKYEENIAAEREKIRNEIRERMDEEFKEYKKRFNAVMEREMREKQMEERQIEKNESASSKGSSCTIL